MESLGVTRGRESRWIMAAITGVAVGTASGCPGCPGEHPDRCLIGWTEYASGAINPARSCQRCEPSQSTSRWTSVDRPCVEAIAAGRWDTCAIVNGGAQCWGGNQDGMLGTSTIVPIGSATPDPVPVSGLTSGVEAIAAGGYHTCAVVNGAALCWGSNYYRALGNDSVAPEGGAIPVPVYRLTAGVQAIAAGEFHSCAVVRGAAQCWGTNVDGALGNDSVEASPVPSQVVGLVSGVQSIAIGDSHTCAVVNGGAQCWGSNGNGQLGDNSDRNSAVPVQVQGLSSGVQAITAGVSHSCAVVDGGARCWGSNDRGQLGNDTIVDSSVPVQVLGLTSGVQAIAAGGAHTCAIVHGDTQCWGEDVDVESGAYAKINRLLPTPVQGLASAAEAIAAGVEHVCALVNGSVQCWGNNSAGQLGINDYSYFPSAAPPVPLP